MIHGADEHHFPLQPRERQELILDSDAPLGVPGLQIRARGERTLEVLTLFVCDGEVANRLHPTTYLTGGVNVQAGSAYPRQHNQALRLARRLAPI